MLISKSKAPIEQKYKIGDFLRIRNGDGSKVVRITGLLPNGRYKVMDVYYKEQVISPADILFSANWKRGDKVSVLQPSGSFREGTISGTCLRQSIHGFPTFYVEYSKSEVKTVSIRDIFPLA